MSGKCMVDTNAIIRLLHADQRAVELFDQAASVSISSIVAGELFYGAENSSRKQENLDIFSKFLSKYEIIGVDLYISQTYGEIKCRMKKLGITIPENDLWIAATAMSNQYPLISFDGHFSRIDGLQVIC